MNVPCLETKRLILRSFEEGDLRALYFLFKRRGGQYLPALVSGQKHGGSKAVL